MSSPRERYLTVVGRRPVHEALADPSLSIAKVHLSDRMEPNAAAELSGAARARGVDVERVSERRVTEIARDGRHHQGVVADVIAPRMRQLDDWLPVRSGRSWASRVLLLDSVHNPANVGMILRTATAAGLDGVVVPDRGTAALGSVAIKASVGVAFKAPILRSETSAEAAAALRQARFELVGLQASGDSLFEATWSDRVAFVLGNESGGLGIEVDRTVGIPMDNGVESLNVAAAATLVAYELVRKTVTH